jgi:hypothetical protein
MKPVSYRTLAIAASLFGGRSLSRSAKDEFERTDWQCARGHNFSNSLYNVRMGAFCPYCSRKKTSVQYLQDVMKVAESKGGVCLSKTYVNNRTKLKFRCKNGHVFEANANNIKSGWWCKYCSGNFKHSIEFYQKLARKFDGELLSKKYHGIKHLMKWRCAQGHVFEKSGSSVNHQGSWCRVCRYPPKPKKDPAPRFKYALEDLQAVAARHGGLCLSKTFSGVTVPVKWQCREGHVWKTKPYKVLNGQWCRICMNLTSALKRRVPLSVYIKMAQKKKGKVLSTEAAFAKEFPYISLQCALGHKWTTHVANVRFSGSWCPVCKWDVISKKTRKPIERYRNLAIQRGGKLLSTDEEYQNSHSRLHWRCSRKHTWTAPAASVFHGTWCPKCYLMGIPKPFATKTAKRNIRIS